MSWIVEVAWLMVDERVERGCWLGLGLVLVLSGMEMVTYIVDWTMMSRTRNKTPFIYTAKHILVIHDVMLDVIQVKT